MSLKTTDCEMINGTYDCFNGLFKTVVSDRYPLDTTYSYALSHDCKWAFLIPNFILFCQSFSVTNPFSDEFKVLSTDFINYWTLYDCKNIDNGRSKNLFWILSRTSKLNENVKSAVDDLIDKYFDRRGIILVNQNSDLCEQRLWEMNWNLIKKSIFNAPSKFFL